MQAELEPKREEKKSRGRTEKMAEESNRRQQMWPHTGMREREGGEGRPRKQRGGNCAFKRGRGRVQRRGDARAHVVSGQKRRKRGVGQGGGVHAWGQRPRVVGVCCVVQDAGRRGRTSQAVARARRQAGLRAAGIQERGDPPVQEGWGGRQLRGRQAVDRPQGEQAARAAAHARRRATLRQPKPNNSAPPAAATSKSQNPNRCLTTPPPSSRDRCLPPNQSR